MPHQPGAGKPQGRLAQLRRAWRTRSINQQLRANRLSRQALALKTRSEQVATRANKLRAAALQSRKKANRRKPPHMGKHHK